MKRNKFLKFRTLLFKRICAGLNGKEIKNFTCQLPAFGMRPDEQMKEFK